MPKSTPTTADEATAASQTVDHTPTAPLFTDDDWPMERKENPFSNVVVTLVATPEKSKSTTASDAQQASTWTNQLHRAGDKIGKTVRTRSKVQPDGRVKITFRVTDRQTRRSPGSTAEATSE